MSVELEQKRFTGRHMLAVMLCFYAAIITANLTMAVAANWSWSGFVVANSYVASQQFNKKAEEARAQAALGWTSTLHVRDGKVSYNLRDAAGAPVGLRSVTATFRRPSYDAEDQTLTLSHAPGGAFEASASFNDGVWLVEAEAVAGTERPYRHVGRIMIREGVSQ